MCSFDEDPVGLGISCVGLLGIVCCEQADLDNGEVWILLIGVWIKPYGCPVFGLYDGLHDTCFFYNR